MTWKPTAVTVPIWPLEDQIAEVKRELAMRERAYPGFIARGIIKSEAEADQHWGKLHAALQTLLWLQQKRAEEKSLFGSELDRG